MPDKYKSQGAVVWNVSQAFGAFVGLCTGLILPPMTMAPDQIAQDRTWQFIYALPLLCYAYLGLGFLFVIKTDGPLYTLKKNDREACN